MATELASAYITLIPSLKGAQESISGQLGGINLSGVGQKIGKSLSNGMTGGINTSTLDSLKSKVESASQAVSAARRREADAAEKVLLAEARLNEVRNQYSSDSSKIIQAENNLVTAQNKAAEAAKKVELAQAKLFEAYSKHKSGSPQVIAAENNLTAAQNRAGEAANKVYSAERKLTEVREKHASGSSKIVAAENNLSKAHRDVASAQDNVKSSTQRLTTAKENLKTATDKYNDSLDKTAKNSNTLSEKFSSSFKSFAGFGAIAGVAGAITSKAIGAISASMDAAIKRTDIMNNFPKVMSNMGISAEASQAAITKMSDKLTGLPTSIDAAASSVQRFTSKNNDVGKSTDMFLALNNALLAGGASTEIQSAAMEQLSQSYAKGKMDMEEWRSLQTAMPAQLNQVAQAMGMSADELGEGLRTGTISMDEFMDMIMKLNTEGTGAFASFEEQAKSATGGIGTQLQNMKTAVTRGIANVLDAIGQDTIGKAFAGINGVIKGVSDVVVEMVKRVKESGLGDAFGRLYESAKLAFEPIINNIGPAFMNFFDGLIEAVTNVVDFFADLFDTISVAGLGDTIAESFGKISETIGPLLEMLGNTLGPIIEIIFGVIVDGLNVILPILSQVVAWIVQIVTWIGNILGPAIVAMQQIWAAVWREIFDKIQAFWTGLTEGFSALVGFFQWLWGVVSSGFESLVSSISDFFIRAGDTIRSLWDGIVGFFSSIWNALSTGASNATNTVIEFVGGLPGKIKGFFSDAGSWLLDAGANIIEGLKNGLVSAFEGVKDFVSGIGSWIAEHKGPKAYDLALLVPNGAWIMQSLAKGLQKGFPAVEKTLSSLTDDLMSTRFDGEMAVSVVPRQSMLRGKSALASAEQLPKEEAKRPIVVQAVVEAILDGRKVGYGTAKYSKEKNDFDEKRRNRIGGVLTDV